MGGGGGVLGVGGVVRGSVPRAPGSAGIGALDGGS